MVLNEKVIEDNAGLSVLLRSSMVISTSLGVLI